MVQSGEWVLLEPNNLRGWRSPCLCLEGCLLSRVETTLILSGTGVLLSTEGSDSPKSQTRRPFCLGDPSV